MQNKDSSNQPELRKPSFTCPHCSVVAKHAWGNASIATDYYFELVEQSRLDFRKSIEEYQDSAIYSFCDYIKHKLPEQFLRAFPEDLNFTRCENCFKPTFWLETEMIYPRQSSLPEPNKDLDDEIKSLYIEAVDVYPYSSRASAALLRLCIEKLCTELVDGDNLNACIGLLVEEGLPEHIQQALDYCRIIGNEALHPGQIDVEENLEIVPLLFTLVNDITQEFITKPKIIKENYAYLPKEKLAQIEKKGQLISLSGY